LRMQDRLEKFSAKLSSSPEDVLAELRQRVDDSIAYVNDVNSRRSERNAKLRLEMKKLDPKKVTGRLKDIEEARIRRQEELDQRIRDAGGEDVNVGKGVFSFAKIAEDLATDLANRITGNSRRIAQVDTMSYLRSPMKMRVLDLPYEIKRKYLELDTEKALARYTRTMSSDIELYRAFGAPDGSTGALLIREEFNRLKKELAKRQMTPEAREKELMQINRAQKRRVQEFEASIERIRGLRGLPDDPSAVPYRLGRAMLNWNVTTMMGGAAINSLPDAARVVFAHGLNRAFGDSWKPFISSLVREAQRPIQRHQVKQLHLLGIGNDVYSQNRSRGSFDITGAEFGEQTRVERGLEWLAAKTPQVAMFGQWTDFMKTMTASATMARLFSGVEQVADGTISKADLEYLATAGIDPQMARRIWDEHKRTGTLLNGTFVPNVEQWTDYAAMRTFHAAMSREDARLVITPGLEKPLWMDASMLGRLVGQFRSFTMAANTKMLVAGLQTRDTALLQTMQGAIFSLALGAVSYYTWATFRGGKDFEDMKNASWQEWMDQALYRSGLLGVLSEVQNIGQEIPAVRDYVTFADAPVAGRRSDSLVGALFGPTFGTTKTVASVIQGINDPTQGTVNQARKLVPWQNVFYLRRGFDAVAEGVGSMFNLPEDRR